MNIVYEDPKFPNRATPLQEMFSVSTNVCYGEGFPKDEECVSKVENAGKRDNSSKKVLVLLFAICGCVLLVGAVSACLAFGLELFKLKSETASSLQQLKSDLEGPPGHFPFRPVDSCAALPPSSPSGYYWVRASNGSAVSVYCDMTRSCGGVTRGWMRVTELDMTNSNNQCPSGLMERTFSGKRTCVRIETTGGCSSTSNFITSGVEYSNVCGRVIGYQYSTFSDPRYVDGVSLTRGNQDWTFAAAHDEVGAIPRTYCPCINTNLSAQATPPPAFVGNDYFCDTGSKEHAQKIFYADDPLWDGAGCGPLNTCCSFNTPPWFYKQLPQSTTDDIEMRVCTTGDLITNKNVAIQIVEILLCPISNF